MNYKIALSIMSLLILGGCVSSPVCNEPYIQVGSDCCLDKNNDNTCSKEEITTSTSGGGVIITRFDKMQPLALTITYRNANFNCTFVNYFGKTIKLINVTMNESISGQTCTVDPTDVNPNLGQSVKPGAIFWITVDDCPVKFDFDIYDLIIVVQYQATVDGITTIHTEVGHIKGPV
jgi:hypothetical protein